MLLVTQGAERQFAEEIRKCVAQQMNARCIILRLSGISPRPDDWTTRTADAVERCLGSEGRIYVHDSADVAVLVKHATPKELGQLFAVLFAGLGSPSLQKLAFLYELPVDAATVVNLFPRAQERGAAAAGEYHQTCGSEGPVLRPCGRIVWRVAASTDARIACTCFVQTG